MSADTTTGEVRGSRKRRTPGSPDLAALAQLVAAAIRRGDLAEDDAIAIRRFLQAAGTRVTLDQARRIRTRLTGPVDHQPAAGQSFNQRLRDRRRALGLSQSDVAARVKITSSYVSLLESGQREPPSPEVLTSLAQVLEVEPEWLLSGEAAVATQRIADLLHFVRYALEHHDLHEAQRLLDVLLGPAFVGRDLNADERDLAHNEQIRVWLRQGRAEEARLLAEPIFERSVRGQSPVRPALSGLGLMNVLMGAPHESFVHRATRAVTIGERALAADPVHDTDWYRLAATVILARGLWGGQLLTALSQGLAWLDELRGQDQRLPAAEAGLLWNVACIRQTLGEFGEALELALQAQHLMGPLPDFAWDQLRLDLYVAELLPKVDASRAGEALDIIRRVHSAKDWEGTPEDVVQVTYAEAQARLALGEHDRAIELLKPYVHELAGPYYAQVDAFLVYLAAVRATGDAERALEACQHVAGALKELPRSFLVARGWRTLAEIGAQIGASAADQVVWYQAALTAVEVHGIQPPPGTVKAE